MTNLDFFKAEDFVSIPMSENAGYDLKAYVAADVAKKANRLLRECGTVVYGKLEDGYANWFSTESGKQPDDTHRALLINIETIEKDTAESLLKQFVAIADDNFKGGNMRELIERARRVLK
jgi:hypothetical protein